jgi:hypothetical protein
LFIKEVVELGLATQNYLQYYTRKPQSILFIAYILGLSPRDRVGRNNRFIDVYCSTIHNSQVMETAKMPQH